MTSFPSRKRRPTDRHRGPRLWVERWSNARSAVIGFLTGRGYSSEAIAAELADGTKPGTIRTMQERWGISPADPQSAHLVIPVTIMQRANIAGRAAQRGLSVEAYCRDIVLAASMPRDRYSELVTKDTT